MLRPGGRIAFCGEPSYYGDRLAEVPKRAAYMVAPLWRALMRAAPRRHGPRGRERGGRVGAWWTCTPSRRPARRATPATPASRVCGCRARSWPRACSAGPTAHSRAAPSRTNPLGLAPVRPQGLSRAPGAGPGGAGTAAARGDLLQPAGLGAAALSPGREPERARPRTPRERRRAGVAPAAAGPVARRAGSERPRGRPSRARRPGAAAAAAARSAAGRPGRLPAARSRRSEPISSSVRIASRSDGIARSRPSARRNTSRRPPAPAAARSQVAVRTSSPARIARRKAKSTPTPPSSPNTSALPARMAVSASRWAGRSGPAARPPRPPPARPPPRRAAASRFQSGAERRPPPRPRPRRAGRDRRFSSSASSAGAGSPPISGQRASPRR